MNYHIYIDEDVKEQAALAVAQGRTLNLKNDIVFKSFFSKDCEESAYCRKKMLSAVIERTVTDTIVLNPEILPKRTDGKYPRLDIHCKLEDGSEVDVELQNSMYKDDQIKRSIYYAATLTHNALSSGDQYAILPHIYQVMFMDFCVAKDARLHHTYLFKERKSHEELSDIVQIHYIELPKTKELLAKPPAQLSELEFWVMLILAGEKKKIRKLLATLSDREEEMRMAQALLKTMSRDQQEWENQFGYERFVHDCISREKYAYSQGEQRGIQQGMQQGMQQGAHERALEDARNLLQLGVSMEIVRQATGIEESELNMQS